MTLIPEFSNQRLMGMKTLYWDDFICAIHGASFLASGGGGSKRLALRYLAEHITTSDTAQLASIDSMAKGDYVTFVAEVYAPGNFMQQEPDLRGGENAYRDFQGLIPTDNPCGVAPAEIGPTSILLSILISVHEATFIVDASSAMRSIAELGMTIFAVDHCYSGDFVVSAGGDYANHFSRQLPSATANEAMQAIANTLTKYDDHYHGAAGFAIYGMDESTLKQVKNLPQNGMQIALKLGQYARLPAAQAYQKIVKELSSITQRPAFVLFEGVICSVQLNYDKASNQTIGFIEFKHETNDHEFLKVYAVNENVIAFYEFRVSQRVLVSKPICIGPDAILVSVYKCTHG
jgi:DUF917 family protein